MKKYFSPTGQDKRMPFLIKTMILYVVWQLIYNLLIEIGVLFYPEYFTIEKSTLGDGLLYGATIVIYAILQSLLVYRRVKDIGYDTYFHLVLFNFGFLSFGGSFILGEQEDFIVLFFILNIIGNIILFILTILYLSKKTGSVLADRNILNIDYEKELDRIKKSKNISIGDDDQFHKIFELENGYNKKYRKESLNK